MQILYECASELHPTAQLNSFIVYPLACFPINQAPELIDLATRGPSLEDPSPIASCSPSSLRPPSPLATTVRVRPTGRHYRLPAQTKRSLCIHTTLAARCEVR